MRLAGLALLAVVSACTGPAASQANGGSPAPSTSPVAVSTPSPTWSLGLGPTAISTIDFSCRLPVFVDIGPGRPGGFIDFPSGTFTPDPAANVDSIVRPGRELVDYFYVHYYDRAFSRWLPVSRKDVSPDGTHYAYTDRAVADPQDPPTRGTLHVVDVKTGVEMAFDDGSWSSPYVIVDYATEGIYLTTSYVGYGLWLVNPTTGAITEVAYPWDVQGSDGDKVFWAGAVNPHDPQPIAGVAPDQLDRLSLVDGSRVPWFYRPGSSVHFVGQDVSGHPVVIVGGISSGQWLLLPAPGVNRSIWVEGNQVPAIGSPISDAHGVWFGSPDGIFLYSEANGMQKVSNQPGYPGNGCF